MTIMGPIIGFTILAVGILVYVVPRPTRRHIGRYLRRRLRRSVYRSNRRRPAAGKGRGIHK